MNGFCFYSAVSARLAEDNSLIELYLNHEFYSRFPVLTDVYNNGKKQPGEKAFWII